jgi:hypothetical protein
MGWQRRAREGEERAAAGDVNEGVGFGWAWGSRVGDFGG